MLLPVVFLAAVLAGCATGRPDIEIGPALAAEPVAGASQVVVSIVNEGDGDDELVGAYTEAALGVELHRTTITDGRATMRELETVEVPAGETVAFRPGELHLMLVVPDETVVEGGTFDLTLELAESGSHTVAVDVVDVSELSGAVDR